jgi:hypothetical protein
MILQEKRQDGMWLLQGGYGETLLFIIGIIFGIKGLFEKE